MPSSARPLQPFNLETMSGIHPGTRTASYCKVLLVAGDESDWFTLSWHAEPAAYSLRPAQGDAVVAWPRTSTPADFRPALDTALAQIARQPQACFACRHWSPVAQEDADGVPVGRCTFDRAPGNADTPAQELLRLQSALSLACHRFSPPGEAHVPAAPNQESPPPIVDLRLTKAAELSPGRLPRPKGWWPRLRAWLRPTPQVALSWEERLVDRSGVGAGTEPCFVCQGRLANLGAITFADEHDDKETVSVWRCRTCLTVYLNIWVDRWERLDNLETEERYYRIAPVEAYTVLRVIHANPGAEHPAGRNARAELRREIHDFVRDIAPLSHQIRQGR